MLFLSPKEFSLSRFIAISVIFHAMLVTGFTIFHKPKEEQSIRVTLRMGGQQNIPTPTPVISPPPLAPTPTPTPKPPIKKEVKEVKKEVKKLEPKVAPTPAPATTEKFLPKQTPVKQPTPPKPIPIKPVEPAKTVEPPAPIIPTKPEPPKEIIAKNEPITPPQTELPTKQEIIESPKVESPKIDESQKLADELEQLLQKKQTNTPKRSFDMLADATWSGTPRKTIVFPDISSQIPAEYQSRGYGYSVTAKIIFSPQGWVSSVELVRTSGDPRIDSIFRNELRKIRIEESKTSSYETITKSFTISVK